MGKKMQNFRLYTTLDPEILYDAEAVVDHGIAIGIRVPDRYNARRQVHSFVSRCMPTEPHGKLNGRPAWIGALWIVRLNPKYLSEALLEEAKNTLLLWENGKIEAKPFSSVVLINEEFPNKLAFKDRNSMNQKGHHPEESCAGHKKESEATDKVLKKQDKENENQKDNDRPLPCYKKSKKDHYTVTTIKRLLGTRWIVSTLLALSFLLIGFCINEARHIKWFGWFRTLENKGAETAEAEIDKSTLQGRFQNAYLLYENELFAEAKVELNALAKESSYSAQVNYLMGSISRKIGDYQAAETYFEEALAVYQNFGPKSGEWKTKLALAAVFSYNGETEKAKELIDSVQESVQNEERQYPELFRIKSECWKRRLYLAMIRKEWDKLTAMAWNRYENARMSSSKKVELDAYLNVGLVAILNGDIPRGSQITSEARKGCIELGFKKLHYSVLFNEALIDRSRGLTEDYSNKVSLIRNGLKDVSSQKLIDVSLERVQDHGSK